MLTFYHAPRSRSFRILWLLEEMGTPYELKLATSAAAMVQARAIPKIRIRTAKCRPSFMTACWCSRPGRLRFI
jgi:hypothetical protein